MLTALELVFQTRFDLDSLLISIFAREIQMYFDK
jgi:hypothetical protein